MHTEGRACSKLISHQLFCAHTCKPSACCGFAGMQLPQGTKETLLRAIVRAENLAASPAPRTHRCVAPVTAPLGPGDTQILRLLSTQAPVTVQYDQSSCNSSPKTFIPFNVQETIGQCEANTDLISSQRHMCESLSSQTCDLAPEGTSHLWLSPHSKPTSTLVLVSSMIVAGL